MGMTRSRANHGPGGFGSAQTRLCVVPIVFVVDVIDGPLADIPTPVRPNVPPVALERYRRHIRSRIGAEGGLG